MNLWLVAVNIKTQQRRWCCLGSAAVCIGRPSGADPLGKFCIDFDSSLSRNHMMVESSGDKLHVRRQEARNALYVNGQPKDEFDLMPGQSFTTGQTRFELTVEGPPVELRDTAGTFTVSSPAAAEQVRDASRCLEALLGLQPLLSEMRVPRRVFAELMPLLRQIVPAATDILALSVASAEDYEIVAMYCTGDSVPAPSRTLVRRAIEMRGPVAHIFSDAALPQSGAAPAPTASAGVHWALAAPIMPAEDECYVLYSLGREENVHFGSGGDRPGNLDRAVLALVAEVLARHMKGQRAERLELQYDLERQQRKISEGLLTLINSLTSTLNLKEVAARLLDSLANVLPLGRAFALMEQQQEGLQTLATHAAEADGCSLAITHQWETWQRLQSERVPLPMQGSLQCTRHPVQHNVEGWLAVPLVSSNTLVGMLLLERSDGGAFTQEETNVAAIFCGQAGIAIQNAGLYEEMHRLAITDELTKIFNRRQFFTLAETLWNDCVIAPTGLSLIAIDVDHFKKVNDTHGHAAGDAVLQVVVERCRGALRADTVFARMGGEEFAVLLSIDADNAARIAERLRALVAATPVHLDDVLLPVTISVGVAGRSAATDTLEMLLQRADAALYQAKEGGRNQVKVADSEIFQT